VVKRFLLDQARDVHIQFENGVAVAGHVERVYYDTKRGRMCTVRLSAPTPSAATTQPSLRIASSISVSAI
jgi:hypothetical protein